LPETADSVPTNASGVGPTGTAAEVLALGRSVRLKLGATLVALVGSFLASVILSRALGREDYGLLVLVYSVTGLAFVLSDFGAKSTLIRYLPVRKPDAESPGPAADLAAAALLIQLAGAAFCALVILGTANLLADRFFRVPALAWPLAIGALYFVGIALRDFVAQLYQSLQDWKREALIGFVFIGSQLLVLGLWVTFADLTVTAALIITGGCAFGSAVLGLGLVRHWMWRRAGALLRFRTVSEHAALVWRFGLPLKAVA